MVSVREPRQHHPERVMARTLAAMADASKPASARAEACGASFSVACSCSRRRCPSTCSFRASSSSSRIWRSLADLNPWWLLLGLVFQAASVTSLWELQRIALRTPSWFGVGTAQLAGNAAGTIIPGGAATAGAFSYRLLVRAGVRGDDIAGGLTAVTVANLTTVLAFPLLALPAILGGLEAPKGLLQTAYIGAAAFVLIALVGITAFLWDRPLEAVGRAVDAVLRLLPSKREAHGTPERLLHQRDGLRRAFGSRWPLALCAVVGKTAFDYLNLLCCLAAVGARPNPSLVVLAYAGASLLSLIPFTPGGLGFVEAGLTGLLKLAGVTAHQAVVTTLAYRLLTFWLPLPVGGIAFLLHRHRYGTGEASASPTHRRQRAPPARQPRRRSHQRTQQCAVGRERLAECAEAIVGDAVSRIPQAPPPSVPMSARTAHGAAEQHPGDETHRPTSHEPFPGRDLARLVQVDMAARRPRNNRGVVHLDVESAQRTEGKVGRRARVAEDDEKTMRFRHATGLLQKRGAPDASATELQRKLAIGLRTRPYRLSRRRTPQARR